MNTLRLLRFLLPMQNPLGFDLVDFVAFGVAGLMLAVLLTRRNTEPAFRWIAARPAWSMGLLGALPIVLRLLLLPQHPVPVPSVSDDFSYLLLGDTLAHFRMANPVHPMHRFFETVFVLQEPSYSSIYPLGQGFVLAFGQLFFRLPWAGVLLSAGLFCALCYWMLRAWVRPEWALAGGLLAVMEFGPLNQWMNNYWGGAVSAIAGCLVFGAGMRLWRAGGGRNAVLFGAGLGLEILTRPFESVCLFVCMLPVLYKCRRWTGLFLVGLLPFLGLTLLQDKAVTGSWTKLPYMLSRDRYGIPATFTFQKMAVPAKELTEEQKLDYQAQKDVHDTSGTYWVRLLSRVRFYRFFLFAPLYVALVFFVPALRMRRYWWAAACVLAFSLAANFYPYFYPHYIAAVGCLFVLMAVVGLQRMPREGAWIVALLCVAHFTFWYGLHLFGNQPLFEATGPYESWDYINYGDSEGRIAVNRTLAASPGKQLVFVRYSARHLLREWIRNDADIDAARVVWALDLGPEEDVKLRQYYASRTAWVVEPDTVPPRLLRLD